MVQRGYDVGAIQLVLTGPTGFDAQIALALATAVPAPTTLALFAAGLLGLAGFRRRSSA